MAKNRYILYGFLVISVLACFSCKDVGGRIEEQKENVRDTIYIESIQYRDTVVFDTIYVSNRVKLQKIYLGEVGVRELTGNNDGERVELYLKSVGLGKGYAWCAAFTSWTFKEAGIKAVVSAWSPDWFKTNTIYISGTKGNTTPQTADVFGIWFNNLGRIAHVGFIDNWQSSTSQVITVEGNTNDVGSREGDGVYRKRRLKSQIYKVSSFL